VGFRVGLDFWKREKSLVLLGNRTTIHRSLSSVTRSKNHRKYINAELLRARYMVKVKVIPQQAEVAQGV
jgi:hypothetical protein